MSVLTTIHTGCDSVKYRTGVRFQSVTEAIRLIAFLFFDSFEKPLGCRRPGAPPSALVSGEPPPVSPGVPPLRAGLFETKKNPRPKPGVLWLKFVSRRGLW